MRMVEMIRCCVVTCSLCPGLAAPAEFTSPAVSLYPDSYTLSWEADSKTEITSFRVLYRLAGDTKR